MPHPALPVRTASAWFLISTREATPTGRIRGPGVERRRAAWISRKWQKRHPEPARRAQAPLTKQRHAPQKLIEHRPREAKRYRDGFEHYMSSGKYLGGTVGNP